MKQNCWEAKECGREPDGEHVHDLGVCPAATDAKLDGAHGGKNAGRSCWVVAGTLCGGEAQGVFATKLMSCLSCDFYKAVLAEEGQSLESAVTLLTRHEG